MINPYFDPNINLINKSILERVRKFAILNFISIAKTFINYSNINNIKNEENNISLLKNIKPGLLFFNQDELSISLFPNVDKNDAGYNNLKEIWNLNHIFCERNRIDFIKVKNLILFRKIY